MVFPFEGVDPAELIKLKTRNALAGPNTPSSRGPHRPWTRSGGAWGRCLSVGTPPARSSRGTSRLIVDYVHAGRRVSGRALAAILRPRCRSEASSTDRGLRTVNPSPYMYFLDFEDFQIVGASPEPLIKVTGRRVEDLPHCRHLPRADPDDEEDRRNAEDLLAHPEGARGTRDARPPWAATTWGVFREYGTCRGRGADGRLRTRTPTSSTS